MNKILSILFFSMFILLSGIVSAEECPWWNPLGFWSECGVEDIPLLGEVQINILDTKTNTGNMKFTNTNEMNSEFLDNSFLKIKYKNDDIVSIENKIPTYSKECLSDVFVTKTDKLETEFYKIKKEQIDTNSIRYINRSLINSSEIMTSHAMFEYSDSSPTISSYIAPRGYYFYGSRNYFKYVSVENEYEIVRAKVESNCPIYVIGTNTTFAIEFHKQGLTNDDIEKFSLAIERALADYGVDKINRLQVVLNGHLIYYMDGLQIKQIGRISRNGDSIVMYLNLETPDEKMFSDLTMKAKLSQNFITRLGSLKDLNEKIDFSIKEKIVEYFLEEEGYNSYSDGFTPKEEEIKSLLSDEIKKDEWLIDAQWGSPFIESKKESYEFSVILNEKPETNIVEFDIETEGLNFYYQNELTQEEKLNSSRPSNVVGSYAVYYDGNKRDNEYKTGKVMHIYRPKIIDAENNWQWADLNINKLTGKLTITINQTFLDDAVYPVLVDPTFGYTQEGASTDDIQNDVAGSIFDGVDGTVDSITVWVGEFGNAQNASCAIYENDTTTNMTLLTNGVTEIHGTTTTYGNNTFDFGTSPTVSSSKTYALVFSQYNNVKSQLYYDDTICTDCGVKLVNFEYGNGDYPSKLNPSRNDKTYSIFATYTESASDTCTYTSGNWAVDCNDNCSITSNIDMGGNNITILGTGSFVTTANITNYKNLYIKGNSSSNICSVICKSGGCFK